MNIQNAILFWIFEFISYCKICCFANAFSRSSSSSSCRYCCCLLRKSSRPLARTSVFCFRFSSPIFHQINCDHCLHLIIQLNCLRSMVYYCFVSYILSSDPVVPRPTANLLSVNANASDLCIHSV